MVPPAFAVQGHHLYWRLPGFVRRPRGCLGLQGVHTHMRSHSLLACHSQPEQYSLFCVYSPWAFERHARFPSEFHSLNHGMHEGMTRFSAENKVVAASLQRAATDDSHVRLVSEHHHHPIQLPGGSAVLSWLRGCCPHILHIASPCETTPELIVL